MTHEPPTTWPIRDDEATKQAAIETIRAGHPVMYGWLFVDGEIPADHAANAGFYIGGNLLWSATPAEVKPIFIKTAKEN